jgi:hypothetical protein
MKDLVDALGTLVAGHIRLARAELGDDARRYARRAAALAVGAALGLVGYGLACVAAALALVQVAGLSPPLAFLVVGGVHFLAAVGGLVIFIGRAAPQPLNESRSALDRTVAALTVSANGVRRAARAQGDDAIPGAQENEGEPDVLTP